MSQRPKILVVDDEEMTRFLACFYLEELGYQTVMAASGQEALHFLTHEPFDAMLVDYCMPGMTGLELLKEVKSRFESLPYIIMTAHGSVERAVVMMREGANDFLQKPLDPDVLEVTVKRSLSTQQLAEENRQLRQFLNNAYKFQDIMTRSPFMRESLFLAEKACNNDVATIALYGESGTGKEMLARAIHYACGGLPDKFVAINCAGIPSGLLESELFGHVKGAFTGADRGRQGKFELCRDGMLLLDEIGDMPLEIQAKLLRVLEERVFEPVGSNKKIPLTAKIVVATHRNLQKEVAEGNFRRDLFFRINVFPIHLLPLRERREDIPLLVEHFFTTYKNHIGKRLPGITDAALVVLQSYDWPGNIRELRNCIERAAILAGDAAIEVKHLLLQDMSIPEADAPAAGMVRLCMDLPQETFSLDAVISHTLRDVLERCDNNISRAAKMLNIDRKMFYRRS